MRSNIERKGGENMAMLYICIQCETTDKAKQTLLEICEKSEHVTEGMVVENNVSKGYQYDGKELVRKAVR